jgi:hypothetical protein
MDVIGVSVCLLTALQAVRVDVVQSILQKKLQNNSYFIDNVERVWRGVATGNDSESTPAKICALYFCIFQLATALFLDFHRNHAEQE